jgi:cyclic beta-1,2-glucan synthetase
MLDLNQDGAAGKERENREGSSCGDEARARALARLHATVRYPGDPRWLLDRVRALEQFLIRARRIFAGEEESEAGFSYGAEWLLDNFHVVQRAVQEIIEDLPEGYYRKLPKLSSTELAGKPRTYAIAVDIIRDCGGLLQAGRIRAYLDAYQEVSPLRIGEIWSLPIMLRAGMLECLALGVSLLTGMKDREPLSGDIDFLDEASGDDLVAGGVISLRMLATEDWKRFFESVSLTERILRQDPVYGSMDFSTRDRYRKGLEDLAEGSLLGEIDVARKALDLAEESRTRDGTGTPEGHVGFYLIDRGLEQLRRSIGYKGTFAERIRRWILEHPTLFYLGSIGTVSLAQLLLLSWYALAADAGAIPLALILLLAIVPLTTVAVSLVNWTTVRLLPPRTLPKMDFREAVPAEHRCLVVIPAMLTDGAEIARLLHRLELHYLGNTDEHLSFGLLADFTDTTAQHLEDDQILAEKAIEGIRRLNTQNPRAVGGPFYLFLRERRFNPKESVWMGWERKRGKIEELNRLILQEGETSFAVIEGERELLPSFRYVITLDADTDLPREAAAGLVGTMAHPLNRPRFDGSGRVTGGYTILQPRTDVKLTSANRCPFTRIYAGDTGLDLYTRAVSDVYQDLFGEAIYVGKGIYDVAGFHRSLVGKVPDNALLSHDLFEGIQGRAGLLTEVMLLEDYPPGYLAFLQRLHRWVRGDWQLLPWILPRAWNKERGNRLPVIHHWKLVDNLRRSLLAPSLTVLLLAAWLILPGHPLVWTGLVLLATAAPLLAGAFTDLIDHAARREWLRPPPNLKTEALRLLLNLTFLPYEALVMVDAIVVSMKRTFVTRRNLLQWTASAHAARLHGGLQESARVWRIMAPAPILSGVTLLVLVAARPWVLPWALPFLAAWFFSPEIVYRISRVTPRVRVLTSARDRYRLSWLARRTWLFFEQFVQPEDHWLPPDHFQESPRGLVAHRTSATNIGLSMLSTLSAYDFGYIGALGLAVRQRNTFEALESMELYRGHFLNWYETRNLNPLPPRYVSTVDSGNLAACLLALQQGLKELPEERVLRWQVWQGLLDTLAVLGEIVSGLAESPAVEHLQDHLQDVREQVLAVKDHPERWPGLVRKLSGGDVRETEFHLMRFLEESTLTLSAVTMNSLRVWFSRVRHHVLDVRREMDFVMPWLLPLGEDVPFDRELAADPELSSKWRRIQQLLLAAPKLRLVSGVCEQGRAMLAQLQADLPQEPSRERSEKRAEWFTRAIAALDRGERSARTLLADFEDMAARCETMVASMDFRFLYDPRRELFFIGYNVDAERLDDNYYDLLASEARIASIVAMAKGDVPTRHWLHLSRPLVRLNGTRALMSWTGTMFEYLMPGLLMHQYENTLLGESGCAAVERHRRYGAQRGVPWGVSESGYYGFDASMNYQYRAFGVPELGFKRGLGDELVITPYASLLALSVAPQEVVRNMERLESMGMLGDFGFYEALDFTSPRLPLGQERAVVRSFMAHHQGMIMLSLTNYLHDDAMIRRFHADPRIQTLDLLLQEQVPLKADFEPASSEQKSLVPGELSRVRTLPWRVPVHTPFPLAHYLSNGRYGVMITNSGSGFSRWQEIELTRWRSDSTLEEWGNFLYLQDTESGALWSVGLQPLGGSTVKQEVLFSPHKADFRTQAHEIGLLQEITVPAEEDAEIRRVTVTNQSDRRRRLRLTSYAPVCLAPHEADVRHPAFHSLFIQSERGG